MILNQKTSLAGLNYQWTPWFDRDSPSSRNDESDVEDIKTIRYERSSEVCLNPLYMEARTKDGVSW